MKYWYINHESNFIFKILFNKDSTLHWRASSGHFGSLEMQFSTFFIVSKSISGRGFGGILGFLTQDTWHLCIYFQK